MPLKFLFVTSHLPNAQMYGAQIRVFHLAKILKNYGDVFFFIINDGSIDGGSAELFFNHFPNAHIARVLPDRVYGFKDRLRYEISPQFLNTHYSKLSATDLNLFHRLRQRHDIIWIHTIKTANIFKIFKWPRSILDVDDIYSQQYLLRFKCSTKIKEKLRNLRMFLVWKNRERTLGSRFGVMTVCSKLDKYYLKPCANVHVVPNGFQPQNKYPIKVLNRIGFIGLFDYFPNYEGIKWFINEVWPLIKRKIPDVQLRLVGKGSNGLFSGYGSDIHGLGFVQDTINEFSTWKCMIVPIRVGGGTRIKIVESFSRMCPVVSTKIGAYGYEVSNRKEILIADNPQQFADACILMLSNPKLRKYIVDNALKFYNRNYTWDAISDSLVKPIDSCLKSDT